MPNLTAIKLALKFAKYVKNPDKRIREEITNSAPPEIKDKLNRIMDSYEKAKKGDIPRDVAIKTIANELGFTNTNEVIEVINDLLSIIEEEIKMSEETEKARLAKYDYEIFHRFDEKNISKESDID